VPEICRHNFFSRAGDAAQLIFTTRESRVITTAAELPEKNVFIRDSPKFGFLKVFFGDKHEYTCIGILETCLMDRSLPVYDSSTFSNLAAMFVFNSWPYKVYQQI
jgi:hypothetical protein